MPAGRSSILKIKVIIFINVKIKIVFITGGQILLLQVKLHDAVGPAGRYRQGITQVFDLFSLRGAVLSFFLIQPCSIPFSTNIQLYTDTNL